MVQHIKRIGAHPVTQWIGGISLGGLIAFSVVLGGYKADVDTMKTDVKEIKSIIANPDNGIVALKTKLEAHLQYTK